MKGDKWYNILQLSVMMLMAAAMPIGWRAGLWAAGLLAVVSIVKMVAERRVGNLRSDNRLRWPLYAVLAYWFYLMASVLWSDDKATAMDLVWLKGSMAIFPLSVLLSDTSYIKGRHLPLFGYSLLAGVIGKFLYCTVLAVIRLSNGDALSSVLNAKFDPIHHAYISLYIAVALVFVYFVLVSQWGNMTKGLRGLLLSFVPLMLLYIIIVNSRAGIIVMYLLIAVCMLHLALTQRRWRLAILLGILLAGFCYGTESVLPGHEKRLEKTAVNLLTGKKEDARVSITRSTTKTFLAKPLSGYGAGDYRSQLTDTYSDDDFTAGVHAEFNAHNQYLESLLSTGIPGLVTLLAMLGMPVLLAVIRRSRYLWIVAVLTFIIAFNLLFESMLERQMGLLFIGGLLAVMVLILSTEENKFVRVEKS